MNSLRPFRCAYIASAFAVLASCTSGARPALRLPTGAHTRSPNVTVGALHWRAVVFESNRDVFVYDRSSGKTRNLTADGERVSQSSPKFIDANTVGFSHERGTLVSVDWRTPGTPKVLARTSYGPSWDASDGLFAGLALKDSPDSRLTTAVLEVGNVARGQILWRTELLSSRNPAPGVEPSEGRELGNDDDRRVEWSPGGQDILVSYTGFYPSQRQTAFVVNKDSHQSIPIDGATFARWLDARHVIYRSFAQAQWWSFDTESRTRVSLGTDLGRGSPAVDPVTHRVAFDTGRDWYQADARHPCDCAVVVLDAAGGRGRTLQRFAASPVWLSDGEMAVTRVGECQGRECSASSPVWSPVAPSPIFRLDDGKQVGDLPLSTYPYVTEGLFPFQATEVDVLRS